MKTETFFKILECIELYHKGFPYEDIISMKYHPRIVLKAIDIYNYIINIQDVEIQEMKE